MIRVVQWGLSGHSPSCRTETGEVNCDAFPCLAPCIFGWQREPTVGEVGAAIVKLKAEGYYPTALTCWEASDEPQAEGWSQLKGVDGEAKPEWHRTTLVLAFGPNLFDGSRELPHIDAEEPGNED